MILITYTDLYKKLSGFLKKENIEFFDIKELFYSFSAIKAKIQKGESFFFIGTENLDLLKALWINSTEGRLSETTQLNGDVLGNAKKNLSTGEARYLYVRPTHTYAMHGFDEQPRFEMVPLLTDKDKYGGFRGYPAMLFKNSEKSLAGGNFKGGWWYVFALDNPIQAFEPLEWAEMIKKSKKDSEGKLLLSKLSTQYPLYYKGEPIRIDYTLENLKNEVRFCSVEAEVFSPNGAKIDTLNLWEEAVSGNDAQSGWFNWYPENNASEAELNGIYTISVTLKEYDKTLYGENRLDSAVVSDSKDCAVYLSYEKQRCPEVALSGANIVIDGDAGYHIGTHLYPSSNFFELSYRPVDVARLAQGIGSMAENGIKICRIWADPRLDELSIRGMEVCIELFARHGIAVDFMFFSSWTRYMSINLPEISTRFEVAHMTDERLIGFFLHNMKEQKQFVRVLAERWREKSHIIWDFSNEFSIVDPLENVHLNVAWLEDSYKNKKAPLQSIDVFNQWALQIKSAIREAEAYQSAIFGASCWNTGSENYRCTKNADIIADHAYYQIPDMSQYLLLASPQCINKPHIMEEFGGVWHDMDQRAAQYDGRFHYYLAAGMAAAMNYEWGVLWLSDRLSGMTPYLKFMDEHTVCEIEDYIFEPRYVYGKSWPNGGGGLCPWMASFEYGNIYPCTETLSSTMLVMKRAAQLSNSPIVTSKSKVCLIIPFEVNRYTHNHGYTRKVDLISETVTWLWENGIDFTVWQEDELETIPAQTEALIYPLEGDCAIKADLILKDYLNQGKRLYMGGSSAWAAKFISKEQIKPAFKVTCQSDAMDTAEKPKVMYRTTQVGTMTVLDSGADLSSRWRFDNLEMETERFGSFLQGEQGIIQAELFGELKLDGVTFAATTGKCIIKANDLVSLSKSKTISLFPYGEMKIEIAGEFGKGLVLDMAGNVLAAFTPTSEGAQTVIMVGWDDMAYEIRLEK